MVSLPVEGYDQLGNATGLPIASPEPTVPTQEPNAYDTIINRLLGTGGEQRYQTWPEKMVRDALAAPSQAIAAGNAPNPYKEGSEEWQDFESRRGAALPQALNMAALAGTGGLGGVGAEAGAALGAGPFLRPALKFNEKIYKAPMGGQHLDALPKEMIPEFNRLAMSGEDISHYDFGFMNHKGQFLSREKALDYAIKEGLIDPNSEAARAGVLTSTMDLMSDTSKPGQAVKAAESPFDFRVGTSTGSRTAKIGPTEITYGVNPKNNDVELSLIRTNKNQRGEGYGRQALEQFLTEADTNGKRVLLNADPMDKSTSKNKLVDFYKSLGFVRNAGNKRDFSTRAEYIREPKLEK